MFEGSMPGSDAVHKLRDRKKDCDSILVEVPIGQFLDLIDHVYKNKGGIEGQRPALKTKGAGLDKEFSLWVSDGYTSSSEPLASKYSA